MTERGKPAIRKADETPYDTEQKKMDNVSWHPASYVGTIADIGKIRILSSTKEFLAQYPNHNVFFDKEEVVGSYRADSKPDEPDGMLQAVKQITEKGLGSIKKCAMVQTGSYFRPKR